MSYDIVSLIPNFCSAFLLKSKFAEGGIACAENLDVGKMDFSPASTESVNLYLDHVRKHRRQLPEQDYTNTVLATGAYLGEVIRRHSSKNYTWVNYDDYFSRNPQFAKMVPHELGSTAILATPNGSITMPFNKIIRYLEEGRDNDLRFYVDGEIMQTNK